MIVCPSWPSVHNKLVLNLRGKKIDFPFPTNFETREATFFGPLSKSDRASIAETNSVQNSKFDRGRTT